MKGNVPHLPDGENGGELPAAVHWGAEEEQHPAGLQELQVPPRHQGLRAGRGGRGATPAWPKGVLPGQAQPQRLAGLPRHTPPPPPREPISRSDPPPATPM